MGRKPNGGWSLPVKVFWPWSGTPSGAVESGRHEFGDYGSRIFRISNKKALKRKPILGKGDKNHNKKFHPVSTEMRNLY
jgi:hypothetical protein